MKPSAAQEPTIAAIATPPGSGGIGILRISGDLSAAILQALFQPRHPYEAPQSHRLYYGWIVDPASKRRIDEVLAVLMRAPHTYTREDVVEIHCHSNFLVLQTILALVLEQGARAAQPGEFTKRAFLNGRIDLTQAEAVIELLNARTRKGLDLAVEQLNGHLQEAVQSVRNGLIAMKATLEVAIDFPDEDEEILDQAGMLRVLGEQVLAPLRQLITSAETGKIYREGVAAVIIGRPNVGKSSLLNALLEEERAIVTAVPGTTRDVIEEYLDIEGMPVRIVDTAGIRSASETVEQMGIERARRKIETADLILLVIDASEPLTEEDLVLRAMIGERTTLLVCNKIDLAPDFAPEALPDDFKDLGRVLLSARHGTNMEELKGLMFRTVTGSPQLHEATSFAPNVRHRDALKRALVSCGLITRGLADDLPADLLAVDLQAALDSLGEIIGQTTADDVLDYIFEQFCIGK